jgi:phosphoserine phosphatase RsbU/P
MTDAELVIQSPDGNSRIIPLGVDRVGLGRSSNNELCYPDDSGLSRQHLAFEKSGDDWVVRDLGSKNGTQVNGTRIAGPHVLKSGDRITAGHLVMVHRVGGAETLSPGHTVCFVPEADSPSSTTVATNLEGVLSQKPGSITAPEMASANSVQILIRAGQELSSHRPLPELFRVILDLSIEAVGATRGLLLILEKNELVVRAANGDNFEISTAVRDRVLNEKTSLLVHDAQFDADLAGRQSIVMQGMRSIMAVPLQTRDLVIGLIYVDTQNLIRPFTGADLSLLTVMANVAAIRLEQARLNEVEQVERVMARELSQAAEIQRGLLPSIPPSIPGIELAGCNLSCRTVGGDYYDFFLFPGGRLGIVVADVAGKGMPAAMMMSKLQAHMQVFAEEAEDPAIIVKRLNRNISAKCPNNRFITFFLGVLDPETGEFRYCNAGHNPPLLVRHDRSVEMLEGGGIILGIVPDAEYETQTVQLDRGDLIALYSDGVTESMPFESEEEFGEEKLGKVLKANVGQHAKVVMDHVLAAITEWTAGAGFADDVTLVIARRQP